MKNTTASFLVSVLLLILSTSPAYSQTDSKSIQMKEFNRKYKENLMRVSIGDTKETVVDKMGGIKSYTVKLGIICKSFELTNPEKNEMYQSIHNKSVEILHFVTELSKNGCSANKTTIPFVFENGQLVGSGNQFYQDYKRRNPMITENQKTYKNN